MPGAVEPVLPHGETSEHDNVTLVRAAYPGIESGQLNLSSALLASRHVSVDALNETALMLHPGIPVTYYAKDSIKGSAESMNDPNLLAGLHRPNLPMRRIELKVGTPIMIIRNLQTGLNNGTRCEVTACGSRS